jgi:hypothetical protein
MIPQQKPHFFVQLLESGFIALISLVILPKPVEENLVMIEVHFYVVFIKTRINSKWPQG